MSESNTQYTARKRKKGRGERLGIIDQTNLHCTAQAAVCISHWLLENPPPILAAYGSFEPPIAVPFHSTPLSAAIQTHEQHGIVYVRR